MRDRELLAIVKGRVQGVGFRATVKRLADALKLTGFVRNLPNGDVEICAQGGKPQLEKLLVLLRQEFPPEYIDSIEIDFHSPAQISHDFRISRYTAIG